MTKTNSPYVFCEQLLCADSLEHKLKPPRTDDGELLSFEDVYPGLPFRIERPNRHQSISMRDKKMAMPKLSALTEVSARAVCIERFANHELMAVELFAWAICAYADAPKPILRGWLIILEEEQQHCRMYLERLRDFGHIFGQHGLPDYFWRTVPTHRPGLEGVKSFLAAMGLTLEQANLDLSLMYRDAFKAAGDDESARLIQIVHDDEVGHVKFAQHWLKKLTDQSNDIAAYEDAVPFPLCGARAKGRTFDRKSRKAAGLSDDFIDYIRSSKTMSRDMFDAKLRHRHEKERQTNQHI